MYRRHTHQGSIFFWGHDDIWKRSSSAGLGVVMNFEYEEKGEKLTRKKKDEGKVAAPRFDRGTSGLWALRAIPAAPCCLTSLYPFEQFYRHGQYCTTR